MGKLCGAYVGDQLSKQLIHIWAPLGWNLILLHVKAQMPTLTSTFIISFLQIMTAKHVIQPACLSLTWSNPVNLAPEIINFFQHFIFYACGHSEIRTKLCII